MISNGTRPLTRRLLVVDDELLRPTTTGGRAVRALVDALRARGLEVLEALSHEDALATVVSDAAIHCVLVNWTLGGRDDGTHAQATNLMRILRARNARVPLFLMADRSVAGTISVEVATMSDEFVWVLQDTAGFIAGRIAAAVERYVQ